MGGGGAGVGSDGGGVGWGGGLSPVPEPHLVVRAQRPLAGSRAIPRLPHRQVLASLISNVILDLQLLYYVWIGHCGVTAAGAAVAFAYYPRRLSALHARAQEALGCVNSKKDNTSGITIGAVETPPPPRPGRGTRGRLISHTRRTLTSLGSLVSMRSFNTAAQREATSVAARKLGRILRTARVLVVCGGVMLGGSAGFLGGRVLRLLPLLWLSTLVVHLALGSSLLAVNTFIGSSFAGVRAVRRRQPTLEPQESSTEDVQDDVRASSSHV